MFHKKKNYIASKVEWCEKITGGDIFITIFAVACYILWLVWGR